jgi:hypothetical protein
MKAGKITWVIILYYILSVVYEIFYPSFPTFEKPWYFVFWYCFYYLLSYGILFAVSYSLYKKTQYISDALALFTLLIYSVGKFVYFMFLINQDFPTYVSFLNSKTVSVILSFFLWSFAILIWVKRYSINRLLKYKKNERWV